MKKKKLKKKKINITTLDQVTDKYIGKTGTPERDQFEFELRIDLVGEMIKRARKEQNLTQEELGKLVGVQKAQISKLENGASNVTIGTILKVFEALKAKVNFKVKMMNQTVKIA